MGLKSDVVTTLVPDYDLSVAPVVRVDYHLNIFAGCQDTTSCISSNAVWSLVPQASRAAR